MTKKTTLKRNKIKKRIRKIVFGTKDKPRLTVFRSNKEIYAQIIDDVSANTIVAASSTDAGFGPGTGSSLAKPGDYKEGYMTKDYITNAQELERSGMATDLYSMVSKTQLGLPKLITTPGADLTREKIALGRKLFYDRRLSPVSYTHLTLPTNREV